MLIYMILIFVILGSSHLACYYAGKVVGTRWLQKRYDELSNLMIQQQTDKLQKILEDANSKTNDSAGTFTWYELSTDDNSTKESVMDTKDFDIPDLKLPDITPEFEAQNEYSHTRAPEPAGPTGDLPPGLEPEGMEGWIGLPISEEWDTPHAVDHPLYPHGGYPPTYRLDETIIDETREPVNLQAAQSAAEASALEPLTLPKIAESAEEEDDEYGYRAYKATLDREKAVGLPKTDGPPAGSKLAHACGCTCPSKINDNGLGYLGGMLDEETDLPKYVYTIGCPVHWPIELQEIINEA